MPRNQIDLTEGDEDHEITVKKDGSAMASGVHMRIYYSQDLTPDVEHQLLARAQRAIMRNRSQ